MGWGCKICKFATTKKTVLLKHYRLHHNHGGQPLPCLYHDCFSSFKTWGSLRSHLSRNHSQEIMERVQSAESLFFTCKCCGASTISTEREFFEHLGQHLKKKERWPALFEPTQINEEFKRITATSLESTFMARLDYCTPKLMNVVSSQGGAAEKRIRQIKYMLLLHNTIEIHKEVAIRCLIVYLGEKEEDLFKEFDDFDTFEADLEMQMMKIAIIGNQPTSGYDHKTAIILVEGTKIQERYNIPRWCALLMGIIYALNLCYYKEFKYTFEVFQKLFLDLDGLKACSKVTSLKHSIF